MKKKTSRLKIILFLAASIGTLLFSVQAQNNQESKTQYGTITGRVIDYITEKPITGVQIKVYKRIVDILPSGAKSIRSMKEVIDLKLEVKTNINGEYTINVPVGINPNYFMVTTALEGYEGMINMFVLVNADETSTSSFEIKKLFLSKEELILLDKKGMKQKEKIEIERAKDMEKDIH